MDAISYSYADKQAKRIKKFINEPDLASGIVTTPKVIAAGETVTIPTGRMAVLPNLQIDGTLTLESGADVFIPSGATFGDLESQIALKAPLSSPVFTGTPSLPIGTIAQVPVTTGNIITMDNIIQKTAVGIGYGTGAGGTVTQLTSKATAVALNKPNGIITMNSSALASGSIVTFILNNSLLSSSDNLILNCLYDNNATSYNVDVGLIVNTQAFINVKNISAGSLSEPIRINYAIVKGATS